VRTTPITLLARRNAALWSSLSPKTDDVIPSANARTVMEAIREQGASFFDELVDATGLLRVQVEEALAELVALGLINSDSFGGLRALLVPSSERKSSTGMRRRRAAKAGMEDAGRWALARRIKVPPQTDAQAVEHVARTLLHRYGVVFWRLLARESGMAAALARLVAGLPQARRPRRDPWRTFRRRLCRRAIRAARSDRRVTRDSSRTAGRRVDFRLSAQTRSTWSGFSPRDRGSRR
jgi:ATP-dependent Lhr-like helicase